MEKRTLHLLTLDPMKGKSFLTSNISYNKMVKRGMRSMAFTVVKPNLVKVSHGVLPTNLSSLKEKKMSSLHVGRFKFKGPTITDKGNPVESDVSGKHEVVIATICKEKGCKTTNCGI